MNMCLASQADIIVIGGFGTGKTVGVAMMACYFGCTLPWFKFLNIAPTSWQAKQMYDAVLQEATGTPFERLIWEKPRRPYPKFVLRFQVGEVIYQSTLEFMSASDDAVGILSWEGDWINIEEAGLLDNLSSVVTSAGTRLRGSVRGRPRMGRLSMISNSWDNVDLWSYFDLAVAKPDKHLSMLVASRHNKNITDSQLEGMTGRIKEEERDQFLEAGRPMGRGNYFSRAAINSCEDTLAEEVVEKHLQLQTPGYDLINAYGPGVVYYLSPRKADGIYIILGDPGTGTVPNRDAPVIMVWEVPPDFPHSAAKLIAFWWGDGHKAITPFVDKLLELRKMYKPVVCGVDSTGPQKNMAEMINIQYLGLSVEEIDETPMVGIAGLDFSGTKKSGYLVVARMFIESKLMTWPEFIAGIRSQLSNYDPAKDRKIAQDIVATVAMSAWVMRIYFDVDLDEVLGGEDRGDNTETWAKRYSADEREKRTGVRTKR